MSILTKVELIDELQSDWISLLKRSGRNNLFVTWEWINSWCGNMVSASEMPIIITAREEGRLTGIAPLLATRNKKQNYTIRFLGQEYAYHLGFIAEKGNEIKIFEALWEHLLNKIKINIQHIEFIHFDKDILFEKALQFHFEKRNLSVEKLIQNPCKVLALPGSFDDYIDTQITSSKLRRNIRSGERRLNRDHQVKFFNADPDNFNLYWSQMMKLHREMMQSRKKRSALMIQPFSSHLEQVSRAFMKKDKLKLSVLEIDGEVAVVMMGIVSGDDFNAITIGVDHKMIQKMPWINLTIHSMILNIRNAIDMGCKTFDFLGGYHDYKYKMGGVDTGGVKISIQIPQPLSFRERLRAYVSLPVLNYSKKKNP